MDLGRLADAEPLLREVIETRRTHLGPEHMETLKAERRLAELLVAVGGGAAELAEAAELSERALAGLRQQLGETDGATLTALRARGSVLLAQGDAAGAVEATRASLAGLRNVVKNSAVKATRRNGAYEANKSARALAAALRAAGDRDGAARADSEAAEIEAEVAMTG